MKEIFWPITDYQSPYFSTAKLDTVRFKASTNSLVNSILRNVLFNKSKLNIVKIKF